MTTIDKLDINAYIQYAQRTQLLEQIQKEYQFDKASTIPPQTTVIDLYPKLSELDLLVGSVPVVTPWAFFKAPPKMRYQRRSPFGFFRVAPSLGSFEEEDEQEERLDQIECDEEDDKKNKVVIKKLFKQIDKINSWVSFIVGRMGQFLQG